MKLSAKQLRSVVKEAFDEYDEYKESDELEKLWNRAQLEISSAAVLKKFPEARKAFAELMDQLGAPEVGTALRYNRERGWEQRKKEMGF